MANYFVRSAGSLSLAQTRSAIRGEEAGGSEFQANHVVTLDGAVTNLVEFEELDEGRPSPIDLIRAGQQAPEGKGQIWTGTMLVSGTIRSVEAYR